MKLETGNGSLPCVQGAFGLSSDIRQEYGMKFVKPAKIQGTLIAPASKSLAQRLLILSSQLQSESVISLGSLCDDIVRCAQAVGGLGAEVSYHDGKYRILPAQHPVRNRINCGESGTCFRMIAAICANYESTIELTGEGSLVTRPMQMIEDALQQLEVSIGSNDHKLPLTICGPIKPGVIEIDGSVSSQFLSGLLLTLPFCAGEFVVKVNNLKSRPYVELTLDVLKRAGAEIHYSEDLKYFQIAGKQNLKGSEFKVEGDWSSIATILVAGAIAGELKVNGVTKDSTQADYKVVEALEAAGAILKWESDSVTCSSVGSTLKAFTFDAEDCPDSIPALVALATNCEGITRISGAERLKHKESDRAKALCQEYAKIGGKVSCEGNYMIIEGTSLKGGTVSSHSDHRIAMSLALAALRSEEGINIQDAEAVAKSYPAFFKDLESVSVF